MEVMCQPKQQLSWKKKEVQVLKEANKVPENIIEEFFKETRKYKRNDKTMNEVFIKDISRDKVADESKEKGDNTTTPDTDTPGMHKVAKNSSLV